MERQPLNDDSLNIDTTNKQQPLSFQNAKRAILACFYKDDFEQAEAILNHLVEMVRKALVTDSDNGDKLLTSADTLIKEFL